MCGLKVVLLYGSALQQGESKFHLVQRKVAKAAYVQRGPGETVGIRWCELVWSLVAGRAAAQLVGESAWLCAFQSVSPRSAVALLQCATQGTLLQERPGLVGTRPEKGYKGAKGIRRNDLWWGKVKRTKRLEPLSLLHGHRNSNGVSCASTEESWIKSLSFYFPIKVTRAEQNGCSSLWTLCKKRLAALEVQDVLFPCQGTRWVCLKITAGSSWDL